MTDDKQLARFKQAVEEKNEEASSRQGDPPPEPDETAPAAPQDTPDERAKSSGHGQVTADKWNQ